MTVSHELADDQRLVPAIGLFALALAPSVLAFMPGFFLAVWNFTDPDQQTS